MLNFFAFSKLHYLRLITNLRKKNQIDKSHLYCLQKLIIYLLWLKIGGDIALRKRHFFTFYVNVAILIFLNSFFWFKLKKGMLFYQTIQTCSIEKGIIRHLWREIKYLLLVCLFWYLNFSLITNDAFYLLNLIFSLFPYARMDHKHSGLCYVLKCLYVVSENVWIFFCKKKLRKICLCAYVRTISQRWFNLF